MAEGNTPRKKKKLSKDEFDRKIKLWGVVVPIIAALLSSCAAILVAIYTSQINIQRKMSGPDRIAFGLLSEEIDSLIGDYYVEKNSQQKEKINSQLIELAQKGANIARKYDPDYKPEWPPSDGPELRIRKVALLALGVTTVGFLLSFFVIRWFLKARYEVEKTVAP